MTGPPFGLEKVDLTYIAVVDANSRAGVGAVFGLVFLGLQKVWTAVERVSIGSDR